MGLGLAQDIIGAIAMQPLSFRYYTSKDSFVSFEATSVKLAELRMQQEYGRWYSANLLKIFRYGVWAWVY